MYIYIYILYIYIYICVSMFAYIRSLNRIIVTGPPVKVDVGMWSYQYCATSSRSYAICILGWWNTIIQCVL